MGSSDLSSELTEYHLRVEEVLSGMDRLLTDLANRVDRAERQLTQLRSQGAHSASHGDDARLDALEERVAALGLAVSDLLSRG